MKPTTRATCCWNGSAPTIVDSIGELEVGAPELGHRFDPSLLRAYERRGVWGETLGPRDAWAVGRSCAAIVRRAGGTCVAVGYDGRLSSPVLEDAVVRGLYEGGVTVRRIGLAPTPLLYYAVASAQEVDGGIEITGSHNPKNHNGFKMDLGGQPFFGQDIVELGRIAAAGEWGQGLKPGQIEDVDLADAYIARILHALDGIDVAGLETLRIGWDTGNGAAGPLIEALVQHLPGHHVLFFTSVDGHFPNHHPDPTIAENLGDLIAAVATGKIDIGFAFDGDGDRLGVVDGRGRLLWGDQILQILARDLLRQHPGARIMADVKSSQALFEAITACGGQALMAPTGHSLIKSGMKQTGAVLAGGRFEKLAIADPAAAPYGVAAIQTLNTLRLYDRLKPKIVTGASIAQAYQFVATGAAEVGFVALSQVINTPGGSRWLVPEADHAPIDQQAVLLFAGARDPAARAFLAFLKSPTATAIIKRYGYETR